MNEENPAMLQSESVLVVGASGKIGLAVAGRFQSSGAKVMATHFMTAPSPGPAGLKWERLDVTDEADIASFITRITRSGSSFDVVVFVAGSIVGKQLSDYSLSEIDETMDRNFLGPVKLLSALLPLLNAGSRVVMFSSVSGERGSFDPVYAAAKGAIIAFVKSMAVRLAPRTRFVAIAPGLVEGSGMFESMAPERREFHRQATPAGRLIEPADIANVVYDLTLEHWAHANGSCVRINGGAYV